MKQIDERDLTRKARIRATAMRLIARDGPQSLTIRETARTAGVSPALVIHHFGSKEGLMRAVSDWLLGELTDNVRALACTTTCRTSRRSSGISRK
ncbi:TetR/AcrR family transcriptional regulator [Mycobacterium sp. MUNTM1]